jgi:hypothetical protein
MAATTADNARNGPLLLLVPRLATDLCLRGGISAGEYSDSTRFTELERTGANWGKGGCV